MESLERGGGAPGLWFGWTGRLSNPHYWLVFFVILLGARIPLLLSDLVDLDEAVWWMGAHLWRAGAVPYVDFIENKPPGIFCLYMLPQLFGVESLYGVHLLALVWVGATAVLVGQTAALLAGDGVGGRGGAGRAAALFYLILSGIGRPNTVLALYTETAAALPLALALYFFVKARLESESWQWRLALAGICAMAAGVFRQPYWVCLPWFALDLLASVGGGWRERGARLGWFCLGVLAVAVGGAVFVWRYDIWDEAFYWWFAINFTHIGVKPPLAFQWTKVQSQIVPVALYSLAGWVAVVAALAKGLRRWRSDRWRLIAVTALMALGSLWTVSISGRWFTHYYLATLVPLVVTAVAVSFQTAVTHKQPGRLAHRLSAFVAGFALLGMVGSSVEGILLTLGGRFEEVSLEMMEAADRVRSLTGPEDPVYVWGFGHTLYYRARRFPPTRFIIPYTSVSGYLFGGINDVYPDMDPFEVIIPEHHEQLLRDLADKPPALFLDYAENNVHAFGHQTLEQYPALDRWLRSHYTRLDLAGRIVFYQRNDRVPGVTLPAPP